MKKNANNADDKITEKNKDIIPARREINAMAVNYKKEEDKYYV